MIVRLSLSVIVFQVQKHSEAALHPHARLPGPFRPTRVPEVDCQPQIHGQEDRLPGSDASVGRAAGCALAHHKLLEKVRTQPYSVSNLIVGNCWCQFSKSAFLHLLQP